MIRTTRFGPVVLTESAETPKTETRNFVHNFRDAPTTAPIPRRRGFQAARLAFAARWRRAARGCPCQVPSEDATVSPRGLKQSRPISRGIASQSFCCESRAARDSRQTSSLEAEEVEDQQADDDRDCREQSVPEKVHCTCSLNRIHSPRPCRADSVDRNALTRTQRAHLRAPAKRLF